MGTVIGRLLFVSESLNPGPLLLKIVGRLKILLRESIANLRVPTSRRSVAEIKVIEQG